MTRREAVRAGVGAFAVAAFGLALKEREPWVADVRGKGQPCVTTASGEIVMYQPSWQNEPVPLMWYEVICELDGKPCTCVYANEATGEVLVYADKKAIAPVWEDRPLVRKTGCVRLIAHPIGA